MEEIYLEYNTRSLENNLTKGEYKNCKFNGCDFSDKDLSEFMFIDCTFECRNLILVKLNKAVLRDVKFKDRKMLGLHFDNCNEVGLSFKLQPV